MKFWTTICAGSLLLSGCAARMVVIPSDKVVHYLPEGQSYTAPAGGTWIVPPERMQEILRRLNDH